MQTATDMVTIVLSRVPPQYGYASLLLAFHTRAVSSELAVTTHFPSRLNTALLTSAVCPRSSATALPVLASHTWLCRPNWP